MGVQPQLVFRVGVGELAHLGLCERAAEGRSPAWAVWASLLLALMPVALAGSRTLPSAIRLGERRDETPVQSTLARSVFREHVFCLASIAGLITLQLAAL